MMNQDQEAKLQEEVWKQLVADFEKRGFKDAEVYLTAYRHLVSEAVQITLDKLGY